MLLVVLGVDLELDGEPAASKVAVEALNGENSLLQLLFLLEDVEATDDAVDLKLGVVDDDVSGVVPNVAAEVAALRLSNF